MVILVFFLPNSGPGTYVLLHTSGVKEFLAVFFLSSTSNLEQGNQREWERWEVRWGSRA